MSLACLSLALPHITNAPPPLSFLNIISIALRESYPSPESLDIAGIDFDLSPSLPDFIAGLVPVFQDVQAAHVGAILRNLQGAISIWMADELRVAHEELAKVLDELYVAVLGAITRSLAPASAAIDNTTTADADAAATSPAANPTALTPSTAQALHAYIDLFAPRLSRAISSAVPSAFASFWATGGFDQVDVKGEESVWEFAKDVVDAVPDLIVVKGLNDADQSRDKSLTGEKERYPHSLESAELVKAERMRKEELAKSQLSDAAEVLRPEEGVELVPSTDPAQGAREGEDEVDHTALHEQEQVEENDSEETPRPTANAPALSHDSPLAAAPTDDTEEHAQHVVSDSYDADISHSPVNLRMRKRDETYEEDEHEDGPVSPAVPSHSDAALDLASEPLQAPVSHSEPTAEDTDLAQGTNRIVEQKEGDVFGPEVIVKRKRKAGRRGASGSGQSLSQSQSDQSQSGCEFLVLRSLARTWRARADASALPPQPVKRARIDSAIPAPSPAPIDDHVGHTELVPATPADPPSSTIEVNDPNNRTSILGSAGRWLAKAGSFGFFSPNRTTADLPTVEPALVQDVAAPVGTEKEEIEEALVAATPAEADVRPANSSERPVAGSSGSSKSRRSSRKSAPSRKARDNTDIITTDRQLKRKASSVTSHDVIDVDEPVPSSSPRPEHRSQDTDAPYSSAKSALHRSVSTGDITGLGESRPSKRRRSQFREGRTSSMASIGHTQTPSRREVQLRSEGEDELLLSPASARAMREEEARERAEREKRRADGGEKEKSKVEKGKGKGKAPTPLPVSALDKLRSIGKATHAVTSTGDSQARDKRASQSQPTQGRYDDAPDDQTPVSNTQLRRTRSTRKVSNISADTNHAGGASDAGPSRLAPPQQQASQPPLPTASPQRSDAQRRILNMLEEAARARSAVENLDFDGLMKLIGHVNELRDAATLNLRARVERSRK